MLVAQMVTLDREGHLTLPPEVLEGLEITFPKDDGDKIRLLCTVQGHSIVLVPAEAALPTSDRQDWGRQQHEAFLRSPLGQYILVEVEKAGDEIPSVEEVRQALSSDSSSWAADIIAEREDRI